MSLVLSFVPAPGSPALTATRFAAHFGRREHVALDGVVAEYLHPDTGAQFRVDFDGPGDDGRGRASLELSSLRPRFFAEEAAVEIRALVDVFGLLVAAAASGDAHAFDEEAFLDAFRDGQARACAELVRGGLAQPVGFPAETLRRAHAWNAERRSLQLRLGESAYVPPVMFGELAGVACTLVVFSDGVPTLIPDFVDAVMVHREELAPMRSMIARETRPGMLTRADAVRLLGEHGAEDAALGAFRPSYVDLPRTLAAAITALPPLEAKLVLFPVARLIDAEARAH